MKTMYVLSTYSVLGNFFSLLGEGLYFFLLAYFLVVNREDMRNIIVYTNIKNRSTKRYTTINILPMGIILIIVFGFGFPFIGKVSHLESIVFAEYNSFTLFVIGITAAIVFISAWIGWRVDRGMFIVVVVLIVINYFLVGWIKNAPEAVCWIIFIVASLLGAKIGWRKIK